MATRVIIMAGGTGGHVFPALAVARELLARGCEVSWLGTPDSFEARTVPQQGIALDTIDAFRLRGQGLVNTLAAPLRLLRAMFQAAAVLRRRRPQVVLGMGGFASGPGGLVSRLLRLPLVIHEQNTIPGLTNRWLAKIATRTLQAFPGTFPAKVGARECGNPVRADISTVPRPQQRFAQRGQQPLQLLVMGGSLGAQALNELLPPALAQLSESQRPRVLHQAGRDRRAVTADAYFQAGVDAEVVEFIDDMPAAYAAADLVVCRSGALTVSELASVGVAALLVPFPYAVDDHQTSNGRFLVEAGAAELVQQSELSVERLAGLLQGLLSAPQRLHEMAQCARELARPDATGCVADACLEVAA